MIQLSVCIEMIFSDLELADRVAKVAELGVPAVEFWFPDGEKETAIIAACKEHGVAVAGFGGSLEPLVDPSRHDAAEEQLKNSCRIAQEAGNKALIVLAGQALEGVSRDEQHANLVKGLKRLGPIAADAGVKLALEPLNTAVDHAGYYLVSSDQGFQVCAEVDHPNVGLLFDMYHQQISEGNLTDRIKANIDRIVHFHAADVPGRMEPGTGELNYAHLLGVIDQTGYDGYVGMEYRPSADAADSLRQVQAMCPA